MIFDKHSMFADKADVTATAEGKLDLVTKNPGKGNSLKVGLIFDDTTAGCTGVRFETSADDTTYKWLGTLAGSEFNGGGTGEYDLPSTCQRYVKAIVQGATAGIWTAGIIDAFQSNS